MSYFTQLLPLGVSKDSAKHLANFLSYRMVSAIFTIKGSNHTVQFRGKDYRRILHFINPYEERQNFFVNTVLEVINEDDWELEPVYLNLLYQTKVFYVNLNINEYEEQEEEDFFDESDFEFDYCLILKDSLQRIAKFLGTNYDRLSDFYCVVIFDLEEDEIDERKQKNKILLDRYQDMMNLSDKTVKPIKFKKRFSQNFNPELSTERSTLRSKLSLQRGDSRRLSVKSKMSVSTKENAESKGLNTVNETFDNDDTEMTKLKLVKAVISTKTDENGNKFKQIKSEYADRDGNKIYSVKNVDNKGNIEEHFFDDKNKEIPNLDMKKVTGKTKDEIIFKNDKGELIKYSEKNSNIEYIHNNNNDDDDSETNPIKKITTEYQDNKGNKIFSVNTIDNKGKCINQEFTNQHGEKINKDNILIDFTYTNRKQVLLKNNKGDNVLFTEKETPISSTNRKDRKGLPFKEIVIEYEDKDGNIITCNKKLDRIGNIEEQVFYNSEGKQVNTQPLSISDNNEIIFRNRHNEIVMLAEVNSRLTQNNKDPENPYNEIKTEYVDKIGNRIFGIKNIDKTKHIKDNYYTDEQGNIIYKEDIPEPTEDNIINELLLIANKDDIPKYTETKSSTADVLDNNDTNKHTETKTVYSTKDNNKLISVKTEDEDGNVDEVFYDEDGNIIPKKNILKIGDNDNSEIYYYVNDKGDKGESNRLTEMNTEISSKYDTLGNTYKEEITEYVDDNGNRTNLIRKMDKDGNIIEEYFSKGNKTKPDDFLENQSRNGITFMNDKGEILKLFEVNRKITEVEDKDENLYTEIKSEYIDDKGNKLTSIKQVDKNGRVKEEHFFSTEGNELKRKESKPFFEKKKKEILFKNEDGDETKLKEINTEVTKKEEKGIPYTEIKTEYVDEKGNKINCLKKIDKDGNVREYFLDEKGNEINNNNIQTVSDKQKEISFKNDKGEEIKLKELYSKVAEKEDENGKPFTEVTSEYIDDNGNKVTCTKKINPDGTIEEHFCDDNGKEIKNNEEELIIYKNSYGDLCSFKKLGTSEKKKFDKNGNPYTEIVTEFVDKNGNKIYMVKTLDQNGNVVKCFKDSDGIELNKEDVKPVTNVVNKETNELEDFDDEDKNKKKLRSKAKKIEMEESIKSQDSLSNLKIDEMSLTVNEIIIQPKRYFLTVDDQGKALFITERNLSLLTKANATGKISKDNQTITFFNEKGSLNRVKYDTLFGPNSKLRPYVKVKTDRNMETLVNEIKLMKLINYNESILNIPMKDYIGRRVLIPKDKNPFLSSLNPAARQEPSSKSKNVSKVFCLNLTTNAK